jgi:adenylate cyclase
MRGAFRSICAGVLTQIEVNAAGFVREDDPEFLHQMRVGMRRLRAVLRTFRPVLPRRAARSLAKKMRKVAPVLGQARDFDVLCQWLESREGLDRRTRGKAGAARAAARRVVRSLRFSGMLAAAREALRWDVADADLATFARRSLEKAHRKALRKAQRIDWSDAERRHALRVRLKRLRYASECFEPCFGPSGTRYVACLRTLQDLLGRLNDIAVGRRLLAGRPQLIQSLEAGEARLLSALPGAWRTFCAARPFWAPRS